MHKAPPLNIPESVCADKSGQLVCSVQGRTAAPLSLPSRSCPSTTMLPPPNPQPEHVCMHSHKRVCAHTPLPMGTGSVPTAYPWGDLIYGTCKQGRGETPVFE